MDGFAGERQLDGNAGKARTTADVQYSCVTAQKRNDGKRIDKVATDGESGVPDGGEVQAPVPEREKVEILAEGEYLMWGEFDAKSPGAGDEELLVLSVRVAPSGKP